MSKPIFTKNYKLIRLTVLIYLFFQFSLNSQNSRVDSLLIQLKNSKNDSIKCELLLNLTELIQDDNIWPIYNYQLYNLSKKKVQTQTDKSLYFHRKLIASANNTGYLLDLRGKTDSSIIYFNECLTMSEKIKDKGTYTDALYNIGKANNRLGNIPKALELLTRSLKLAEEENLHELAARILISLGLTFQKQGDLSKALEYYQKAFKLQQDNNDVRGSAYSMTNLAGVYLEKNDYNNSLNYFSESMILFLKIGDYSAYLTSKRNTAKLYINKKDYPHAILICKELINDTKINLYQPLLSRTYDMLGSAYTKSNRFKEALECNLIALKIAEELKNPELIRNSNLQLTVLYKKLGDFTSALKSYEVYIQLRDSMNNQETRKASIKSQLKYEYEKKAAADSVKVAQEKKITQVKLKQEKMQRYYLYIGFGFVGVFALFMVNRYRITNKQKKLIELQKQEVEKQKYLVDEKQKEILDSIRYAKRIQQALLPNEKMIERILRT